MTMSTMRLFQHFELYPAYDAQISEEAQNIRSYAGRMQLIFEGRCEALHLLAPVVEGDPEAFATSGMSESVQRIWAREQGLKANTPLVDILLAQIEAHRTEVFYDIAPMRFDGKLVGRLPGCVKKTIAWHAAPSIGADFGQYDLLVCNFPSILEMYRAQGWNAASLFPAYDPQMTAYSSNTERPVDVLFVGTFSRHHAKRAELLETFSSLNGRISIEFYLNSSRLTALAESPIGRILPLGRHRRPKSVSCVSRPPLFGRDLYRAMSRSKIVLNGAIDMAGSDRGNLRCFESMGCGSLLYSDAGVYPRGMESGVTMQTYESISEAVDGVLLTLRNRERLERLAAAGHEMVRTRYSKARQWEDFVRLVQ